MSLDVPGYLDIFKLYPYKSNHVPRYSIKVLIIIEGFPNGLFDFQSQAFCVVMELLESIPDVRPSAPGLTGVSVQCSRDALTPDCDGHSSL